MSRTLWSNGTLWSSSAWITSTGERHCLIDDSGDDAHARLSDLDLAPAAAYTFNTPVQSCTPA